MFSPLPNKIRVANVPKPANLSVTFESGNGGREQEEIKPNSCDFSRETA